MKKINSTILLILLLAVGCICLPQVVSKVSALPMDCGDNACAGTNPPPAGGTVPLQRNPTPPPPPPPPSTPNPNYPEKSAARFSSMHGQVEVSSDGGNNWRSAKLDMVLNAEDWVKTDEDSTAILSFADMSTFELKPESTVIIVRPAEKDSKWKLVAGNIWVNVKRMLKDGSMEIDLNQAVAGIKGTTFKLWETGARNSSIIQVEEGVVSFRHKTTGQTIEVKAGQTVSATPDGFVNGWKIYSPLKAEEQWSRYGESDTDFFEIDLKSFKRVHYIIDYNTCWIRIVSRKNPNNYVKELLYFGDDGKQVCFHQEMTYENGKLTGTTGQVDKPRPACADVRGTAMDDIRIMAKDALTIWKPK